jgi:predicted DNA-binding antitoxin AbrB/MazE fold protein
MAWKIDAVFRGGVLQPTASLPLPDGARVRLVVELLDRPGHDRAAAVARLRAGIASMHFFSDQVLPDRDICTSAIELGVGRSLDRRRRRGAEEGDATSGRGWPLDSQSLAARNSDGPLTVVTVACLELLGGCDVVADGAVRAGGALCPPGERPSTDVAIKMGRERPRLRIASAAPSPTGGVAHAPRVNVRDVLGRVLNLCRFQRAECTSVSRTTSHGESSRAGLQLATSRVCRLCDRS